MVKTVKNPNRSRKFGWGYTFQPTGKGTQIETPEHPKHEGTIGQCLKAQRDDRTYQAHRNAFHTTAWFYEGRRIIKFESPDGLWEYPDRSEGNFPPDPLGDELHISVE